MHRIIDTFYGCAHMANNVVNKTCVWQVSARAREARLMTGPSLHSFLQEAAPKPLPPTDPPRFPSSESAPRDMCHHRPLPRRRLHPACRRGRLPRSARPVAPPERAPHPGRRPADLGRHQQGPGSPCDRTDGHRRRLWRDPRAVGIGTSALAAVFVQFALASLVEAHILSFSSLALRGRVDRRRLVLDGHHPGFDFACALLHPARQVVGWVPCQCAGNAVRHHGAVCVDVRAKLTDLPSFWPQDAHATRFAHEGHSRGDQRALSHTARRHRDQRAAKRVLDTVSSNEPASR
jgi:hypothetical protein